MRASILPHRDRHKIRNRADVHGWFCTQDAVSVSSALPESSGGYLACAQQSQHLLRRDIPHGEPPESITGNATHAHCAKWILSAICISLLGARHVFLFEIAREKRQYEPKVQGEIHECIESQCAAIISSPSLQISCTVRTARTTVPM